MIGRKPHDFSVQAAGPAASGDTAYWLNAP